jgi:hypothetical protein
MFLVHVFHGFQLITAYPADISVFSPDFNKITVFFNVLYFFP